MGDLINFPQKENKALEEANKDLDSRFIKDSEGNVLTDENDMPVFRDRLGIKITNKDLKFIWQCIADLLNYNVEFYQESLRNNQAELDKRGITSTKAVGRHLVMPEEVPRLISVMEMLAGQEKKTNKQFMLELPSNYFYGTWCALKEIMALGMYNQYAGKKKWLEDITMGFAKILDSYHEVLRQEKIEDNIKVEDLADTKTPLRIADKKEE